MEAVAEAPTAGEGLGGELAAMAIELGGGAAFGHQENSLGWDGESASDGFDFGEIRRAGGDEFEPGFRAGGEMGEHLRDDACRLFHAGVREFGGNVELVDGCIDLGSRHAGAVGFDLENESRIALPKESDEFKPVGLLEQRFAAGEDDAASGVGKDELGDFFRTDFDGDV